MGMPLFSYKVSQGIHSILNSNVIINGYFFESKLRKFSEHIFLCHHERKLETFAKICVVASLEILHEDPTIRTLQKSTTTGCLETEISRTAPDSSLKNLNRYVSLIRIMHGMCMDTVFTCEPTLITRCTFNICHKLVCAQNYLRI